MHRLFLAAGCLLAFLAVAAGAFGAHGLEASLSTANLAAFETGARYQMYHALALILVGLAAAQWPRKAWAGPGLALAGGTIVFSGSLYAFAVTDIGFFGAITPIGGATLLVGWVWLALVALRDT